MYYLRTKAASSAVKFTVTHEAMQQFTDQLTGVVEAAVATAVSHNSTNSKLETRSSFEPETINSKPETDFINPQLLNRSYELENSKPETLLSESQENYSEGASCTLDDEGNCIMCSG